MSILDLIDGAIERHGDAMVWKAPEAITEEETDPSCAWDIQVTAEFLADRRIDWQLTTGDEITVFDERFEVAAHDYVRDIYWLRRLP